MARPNAALAHHGWRLGTGLSHGSFTRSDFTRSDLSRGNLSRRGFSNHLGPAHLGFHAVHECDRDGRRFLCGGFQRRECELGSLLLRQLLMRAIRSDQRRFPGISLGPFRLGGCVLGSSRFGRAQLRRFLLAGVALQGAGIVGSAAQSVFLLRFAALASCGSASSLRDGTVRDGTVRGNAVRGTSCVSVVGFLLCCPARHDAGEPRRPGWNGAIRESSRNDLALGSGSDRLYIVERSTDGRDSRGPNASIVFGRGGFGCPVSTIQGFHVATLPV